MMDNAPRLFALSLIFIMLCGCNTFQTTKNVWKGTKQLWATYVSPPAYVDYEDKGDLSPQALALSKSMLGVDMELSRLERVMQNADRPPTREWMQRLFENFPWLSGFAGVKYDGTILGREPAESLKYLDFNYLLHEDSRQKSRALRADVQPSPMGPEVMLASPLYDGIDFLGIVVAYFDMRALMRFSENAQDIVVLCPTALLWPGKYDFAATPLAGTDWAKVTRESSSGTCSNANGTFFYLVRYFANLPLVFAVPQKGDFQDGNGGIEQGFAFFPPEREKGTPPPVSEERLKKEAASEEAFGRSEEGEPEGPELAPGAVAEPGQSPNDLQPGSRDSVLLKQQRSTRRHVEERALEGENVPVQRVQRPRRRPAPPIPEPELDLLPDQEVPTLQGGRPSPFGPRDEESDQGYARPSPFGPREDQPQRESTRPSPFGPPSAQEQQAPQPEPVNEAAPAAGENQPQAPAEATSQQSTSGEAAPAPAEDHRPAMLPGGRPSPFGPR